ncbi:MAG: alanine--tRNA ligase [Sulfurovum sp.]
MDIRKAYLDFFQEKGHQLVESSTLIPDDATLMFTNAGMVQFKNIFIGEAPIPNPPRATSSQTCLRAGGKHNDLDNVGYTARHHTLFEMLGNFSFADYFKDEAIAYAWEFITDKKYLNLPIDKIWVTVHTDDNEAFGIWAKHIDPSRIVRFGDKDNFWQMGDTGPCGPCSEIFYDQGAEYFSSDEDVIGGDGDRFLEIWNLVFMQYEKDADGKLIPLPKPSIDTGMGLERVIAIKEGKINNYHSSLFLPFLDKIGELIGTPYHFQAENSASYRVIADHLRSCSFLLAQGINFDKEGRGYVLRRIMRRAIRHGYLLGFRQPFVYKLVDTLVSLMGHQYPYLVDKVVSIKGSMKMEEKRFFETIEAGITLFNREIEHTKDIFDGEIAFKLYDTYGFPLDLTQDMLRERDISLDIEAFNAKMKLQKEQSKANWKGTGDVAATGDFKVIKETFGVNKFVGYNHLRVESKVLALLDENFNRVTILSPKDKGWIMLDETPFYATSGGQVGDKGEIEGRGYILDTQKFLDMNLSQIEVRRKILMGDVVVASVEHREREEISKHHSATHLLHAGLIDILGSHISQAGSLVESDRLRFDFTHPQALTQDEINQLENWVNHQIIEPLLTKTEEMNIEKANESGAKALFGEKYGDKVRVVNIGEGSIEFCGGTHVVNTADIGIFIIAKESGVSAGVRRIEAICGKKAVQVIFAMRNELKNIKTELKNQDAILGITKLKEQIKELKSEVQEAHKSTKKELTAIEINGKNVIIEEIEVGDIKEQIDEAKNRYDNLAIMLFQKKGKKVMIACGSKETSIKAGNWIKEIAPILGGGGGGRPDFAQAGGKDITKIKEAKEKSLEFIKANI